MAENTKFAELFKEKLVEGSFSYNSKHAAVNLFYADYNSTDFHSFRVFTVKISKSKIRFDSYIQFNVGYEVKKGKKEKEKEMSNDNSPKGAFQYHIKITPSHS